MQPYPMLPDEAIEGEWPAAVVGLLNTAGGILRVFSPKPEEKDPRWLFCRVKERLIGEILPPASAYIHCAIISLSGGSAVELTVSPGNGAPFFLAGEGMEHSTWLWKNNQLRLADKQEIHRMLQESGGGDPETRRCIQQELTLTLLKKRFFLRGLPFGKPQQVTLGLIDRHGLYTNLAYFLSDQKKNRLEIVWVEGNFRVGQVLERTVLESTYFQILPLLLQKMEDMNRKRALRHGSDPAQPDFPPEVTEEVLLLLPMMMDFFSDEKAVLRLYGNRMELRAPGGPLRCLSYADMQCGRQLCRNPRLCELMERIRPESCMSLNLTQFSLHNHSRPGLLTFEYDTAFLRITVPSRHIYREPLQDHTSYSRRKNQLFSALKQWQPLFKKDLAALLGITYRQAARLLNRMMQEGLLHGNPREGIYYPSGKLYFPEEPDGTPMKLQCSPVTHT